MIAAAVRRLLLAAVALGVSAFLFRSQIADGLVARGDDLLYKDAPAKALQHYARALAIDPLSQTAADRYVFVSMERHTRASLFDALHVADAYLRARPADAAVLSDRALCLLVLRRYSAAAADFERAARAGGGAQYQTFARQAALAAAR